MKMLLNYKWEDSTHNTPTPQSQRTDSKTDVSESMSDRLTKNDAPQK